MDSQKQMLVDDFVDRVRTEAQAYPEVARVNIRLEPSCNPLEVLPNVRIEWLLIDDLKVGRICTPLALRSYERNPEAMMALLKWFVEHDDRYS